MCTVVDILNIIDRNATAICERMYRCGTARRVALVMELDFQVQSTELGPQKTSDLAAAMLQSVSPSLSASMGTALRSAPLECCQQQCPGRATKHHMLATSSAACSSCSPQNQLAHRARYTPQLARTATRCHERPG